MKPISVQRHAPFGRLGRRRVLTLAIDRIHPLIRIAHRQTGRLNIPERIIFDHEFVLVLKGRGTWTTRDTSIPFEPGTLLFVRPFVPHTFDSGDVSCEHIAVHFDFTHGFVDVDVDPQSRRPYEIRLADGLVIRPIRSCPPGGAVADLFARLVQARTGSNVMAPVEEAACLFQILCKVMTPPGSDGEAPAGRSHHRDRLRVARTISYLNEHLADPLDLEKLAGISALSASQFVRLFRRHTGYSPMRFLRRTRVQRARELLIDPDLSIKEIARSCGFDDACHFSRVFHHTDGLPPSDYRESILAGRNKPE